MIHHGLSVNFYYDASWFNSLIICILVEKSNDFITMPHGRSVNIMMHHGLRVQLYYDAS